jgi:hypothetical protein
MMRMPVAPVIKNTHPSTKELFMAYQFRGMSMPTYMEGGVIRFIEQGVLPGDFLRAVLSNDLRGAVDQADSVNFFCIPVYIGYFYNNVPSTCWGTKERMLEWSGHTQEEREEILALSTYKSLTEFA